MPHVIERGYLYIAQPPLFKVKKGKDGRYLESEKEFEDYFLGLGTQKTVLKVKATGRQYSQDKLLTILKTMLKYKHYSALLRKRGATPEIINTLLKKEIKQKAFFKSEKNAAEFLKALADYIASVYPSAKRKKMTHELVAKDDGFTMESSIEL
jgi:DNA gyrase subunit B